ncbi:MAG: UDP-N-acetylglucosamine 4,6-dehydratase [Gammaproteobacteria bacterium]|nr:UDP-N-acetylglucosamine 4,6-dehydratase [Gammaproteobacteria bacterium]MBU1556144.1 UDP-N-acetylglucosamine 4,6-dehydratase [Gammaproteobacteria bacterium]MBU2069586.1 UDP-N-acetylglucosamine 4,6-dehydratase [Gammaproteobacteria bacterium]MBU2184451.1 UDP-N-acetylglucosamine 4,6-dehydratase [Gammaproteobacteria bacterium]MBU2205754.1 UDP-N-acetylglucosamine 4,6-dehydratase [Gammaproteobacteria bacterium]
MTDILALIGRSQPLFTDDIASHEARLSHAVSHSRFLVLGGAGSIGQAVCKEIFRRQPEKLHVVDISENNLVELVRDIRSGLGYINGDFQTYALDIGSVEFDAFYAADGQYDYVLNLSALKHVRSEKDPYTLMRMIEVNILNTDKTIRLAKQHGCKKYFCVSTDKAANPVNMMGASKRIMELFLQHHSTELCISTARFANVAFSDGSLLHGFNQRLEKQQPIAAPNDIKRYFVTPQESGELCLMSCIFGENGDIFFPKLSEKLHLITFADIALKYLQQRGYSAVVCDNEQQAREQVQQLSKANKWPCVFSSSDTTGEKDFEEFFTADERLDMQRFAQLGIVKNRPQAQPDILQHFVQRIAALRQARQWTKTDLVELFQQMLPQFGHKETGRYLDSKM